MLPHNKTKRRRRSKKPTDADQLHPVATATALVATADIPAPPQRPHAQKPRATAAFRREDRDVSQALRQHSTRPKALEDDEQRDRELAFFTGAIPLAAEHAASDVEDNDDDADIVADPLHKTAAADDEKTLATTTIQSEATGELRQLASSFVQIEDDPPVRPWTPQQLPEPDAELFYDCHETLPAEDGNDEDVVVLPIVRDVSEDGLYVPQRPAGLTSKSESFIVQRLLATGHPELVQETPNGTRRLRGVQEASGDLHDGAFFPRRLPAKRFRPVVFDARQHFDADTLEPRTLRILVQAIVFDRLDGIDEEHLISDDIQRLFDTYEQRQRDGICERLEKKLEAIRRLLATATSSSHNHPGVPQPAAAAEAYRSERRDLRNQLHREQQTDRQLIRTVLEQWKRLKDVRQQQGAAGTALKLVIRTQEHAEAEDLRDWTAAFQAELQEVIEEAMQFFEQSQRAPASASPMRRPDERAIENMLYDIYGKSRRPPGEPSVRLELEQTTAVGAEASKRRSVQKKMRVLVVVGRRSQTVQQSVQLVGQRMQLNAAIALEVRPKENRNFRLLIHEADRSATDGSAIELFWPLPQAHDTFGDATDIEVSFSTKSATSGRLTLKLGWSEVTQTCSLGECLKPKAKLELGQTMLDTWYQQQQLDPMDPDVASLCQQVRRTKIGQNKAKDSNDSEAPSNHGMFRLNEDLTAFCSQATIDGDPRLSALLARSRAGQLANRDQQIIAPIAREIERSQPRPANTTDDDEDGRGMLEDLTGWMDPIDMQRHNGRKYLLKVYRTLAEHCQRLRRQSSAQDLLRGNDEPTVATFLATIRMLLFRPRTPRPMDPQQYLEQAMASERQAFFGAGSPVMSAGDQQQRDQQGLGGEQCRLMVHVLRAHGLPMRRSDVVQAVNDRMGGGDRKVSSVSAQLQQRSALVSPYVVVSVRGRTVRTHTAEGANPTWNEQLQLLLGGESSSGRGVDPSKDMLCVQLFDEVVEDLLGEDDRMRGGEVYQRISGRWLGELRMPMWTVLSERRIEGTFEMTTPQILLGYSKASLPSVSASFQPPVSVPQMRSSSFVTLFIHLEPSIAMPTLSPSYLECTETAAVASRIAVFVERIGEEFPDRVFDPLVALSNGKRVCITRLCGAIDLPFERTDVTEYLIRRFVSLVPSRRVFDVCTQLNGVWLANDQVLTLLCASAKDLGTMLASFYLTLGHRALLVIGHALPHGDTAFVLIKENGAHQLIDPTTGRKYAATDQRCPLSRAYACVGPSNVWTNLQREQRVSQTRFDVGASGEWRPLFASGRLQPQAPLGSVHNASFVYAPSADCQDLRRTIEWKLQKKISAWRTHRRTVWNRNLNEQLQRMLEDLEEDACFEYEPKGYADRLQHLQGVYSMSGYPVHMAYESLSAVVERVRATGIHLAADAKVEFSLTVSVQAYPCNVLSVWVFLLALVPKS